MSGNSVWGRLLRKWMMEMYREEKKMMSYFLFVLNCINMRKNVKGNGKPRNTIKRDTHRHVRKRFKQKEKGREREGGMRIHATLTIHTRRICPQKSIEKRRQKGL